MPPRGKRSFRAVGALLAAAGLWTACGSNPGPPPQAARRAVNCKADEAREYFCDDLLPRSAALPAPPPYDSCPSTVDHPASEYDPPPAVGVFDVSYTEYTRKRAPPGHACCYSWCSPVKLGDPTSPAARAACGTPSAFREEYCMPELEGGTSLSVGSPFDRCPAAISPPSKAVFSAPSVALFDTRLTHSHRGKGAAECCYAWCSQAPAGSGILK